MADPASSVPRGWSLAFLACAAALLFASLGATPTVINAEERCEEVVRGMVETGDWLMPRMDGAPRVNKPPLFYWLSTAACRVAGRFDLAAYRLPSALAGLGVLLLVLAWGRELASPREALLAAAMLSVTYEFLVQARMGSFEMVLCFFCNAALFVGHRAARAGSWRLALLSAILFGLAFLTKGPPAILFTMAPLAGWAIARRRLRVFADARLWGVVLIGLLVGISWHLCMVLSHRELWQVFRDQALIPFGVRAKVASTARHTQPVWWYFREMFRKGFLLTLFVPSLFVQEWRRRGESWDSGWRLLFLSVVVPFVVMSSLPGKQDHYLLPALPPLALVTARALVLSMEGASWRWIAGASALLALTASLVAGPAAAWLLVVLDLCPLPVAVCGGAAVAALSVWGILWLVPSRWPRAAAFAFLAAAFVWMYYFSLLKPLVDGFGSGKIAQQADYDDDAWREKFDRHPYVARFMHYKAPLPADDEEDEH